MILSWIFSFNGFNDHKFSLRLISNEKTFIFAICYKMTCASPPIDRLSRYQQFKSQTIDFVNLSIPKHNKAGSKGSLVLIFGIEITDF